MFPAELGRLQWFLITLYGSLYNTSVQCWTHVALICLTFFSRCLGPIINHKRTLIFWYRFSTISVFSSLCWVASALRFIHLSTRLSPLSPECLVWGSLWRLIDQVSPCSSSTEYWWARIDQGKDNGHLFRQWIQAEWDLFIYLATGNEFLQPRYRSPQTEVWKRNSDKLCNWSKRT